MRESFAQSPFVVGLPRVVPLPPASTLAPLADTLPVPSAHHLHLRFLKDSADFYYPMGSLLLQNEGVQWFQLGNSSEHAACYAITDTATGIQTTYFADPITYRTIWSVSDTGFGHKAPIFSEPLVAPYVTPGQLSLSLWRNSPPGIQLQDTAPIFEVFPAMNQPSQCIGRYGWLAGGFCQNFISPIGTIMNESSQRDLTGDGIMEHIATGVWGQNFKQPYLVIYNGDAAIDTIRDDRWYLTGFVATTHDVNADGMDEIVVGTDGDLRFYQWNAAQAKFLAIDSLFIGVNGTIELVPHVVDASGTGYLIGTVPGGLVGNQFQSDSVIVWDHALHPKYIVTWGGHTSIKRMFTANLLGNGHRQIVVVSPASALTMKTEVYDLASGLTPIWEDSNFEAQYAVDLQKKGTDQLLGLVMHGPIGATWTGLRLVDPKQGFTASWELVDSANQEQIDKVVGPFGFDPTTPQGISLSSGALPPLMPTDVNGNGTLDFVVETHDVQNFRLVNPACLVMDANGDVLDTIQGLSRLSTLTSGLYDLDVTSYDLDGNGTAELMFSEYALDGNYHPYPLRGSVWDWNAPDAVAPHITEKSPLAIYPNPSGSFACLSMACEGISTYHITIANLAGAVEYASTGLLHRGYNTIQLDLTSLQRGSYLIEVSHNGHIEHGMLVKAR